MGSCYNDEHGSNTNLLHEKFSENPKEPTLPDPNCRFSGSEMEFGWFWPDNFGSHPRKAGGIRPDLHVDTNLKLFYILSAEGRKPYSCFILQSSFALCPPLLLRSLHQKPWLRLGSTGCFLHCFSICYQTHSTFAGIMMNRDLVSEGTLAGIMTSFLLCLWRWLESCSLFRLWAPLCLSVASVGIVSTFCTRCCALLPSVVQLYVSVFSSIQHPANVSCSANLLCIRRILLQFWLLFQQILKFYTVCVLLQFCFCFSRCDPHDSST